MTTGQRLERLHRRLRDTADDADTRLLAEDQLLVTRNLIRNPAAGHGVKAADYLPGPNGYQVYVAYRTAEAHASAAAPASRPTGPAEPAPWDARTMRLRLAPPETSGGWVVRDGRDDRDEIVTVHAAAGSVEVLDDVNAILSEVEAVLLT